MKSRKLLLLSCASLYLAGCGTDKDTAMVEVKSEPQVGEVLYTKNCKVCHAQGINGAPILGNKKMWAPRAGQGKDVLVSHAVNGFGLMPAKGGKTALTEEEISEVVGYMLSKIQ
jgi:cytochrome c5